MADRGSLLRRVAASLASSAAVAVLIAVGRLKINPSKLHIHSDDAAVGSTSRAETSEKKNLKDRDIFATLIDATAADLRSALRAATRKTLDKIVSQSPITNLLASQTDATLHPEIKRDAKVRTGSNLGPEEVEYRSKRRVIVARALSSLLGEDVDPRDAPTIALATSGGGCRAAVAALGAHKALSEKSLLDLFTYWSATSGSTWAQSQVYSCQGVAIDNLKRALGVRWGSADGVVDLLAGPAGAVFARSVVGRVVSGHKVGGVDLFGGLLGGVFLGGDRVIEHMSRWDLGDGRHVLPISCAVTRVVDQHARFTGDDWQWLEFSPLEVGGESVARPNEGFWIPTWSFGRHFSDGASTDNVPETHLGTLLGVFGSAFSADFSRILDEIDELVPTEARRKIESLFKGRILDKHPIAPARFNNPAYNLSTTVMTDPISSQKTISIMDAGMDNSLPIPPLLRRAREVDLILIVDASRSIASHPFLRRARAFAERRGVNIPLPLNTTSPTVLSKPSLTSDDGPAAVVYVPLAPSKSYREGWDPFSLKAAATHNFLWNQEDVDSVAGLIESLVSVFEVEMKEVIRGLVHEKRRKRLAESPTVRNFSKL